MHGSHLFWRNKYKNRVSSWITFKPVSLAAFKKKKNAANYSSSNAGQYLTVGLYFDWMHELS